MKYLPLIWAGLWRKPLRTIFTTLALVVAFVLFGLLQGINAGFGALVDAARDDALYVYPRYESQLPSSYKAQLLAMPGVKSVTSAAFMGGIVNGDLKKQVGISFVEDGFFDFYRWLVITPQQIAELRANRTDIVMGVQTAERLGLKAGDHFTVKSPLTMKSGGTDWTFNLLAVVTRKDIANYAGVTVGNLEYLNEERTTGTDMFDWYMVMVDDPKAAPVIAKAIDAKFLSSGAPTRTSVDKEAQQQSFQDDNLHTMVNAIVLATLFALLLMTSNSMMQSFRERVPEFGTLKALGFNDGQVLVLIVGEALVQCILGAVIGLAIARAGAPFVKKLLTGPSTMMTLPWWLLLAGLAVAGLVALVSAAIPAWRASRLEIVNALAVR